jgi:hypothetical protein
MGTHTLLRYHSDLGGPVLRLIVLAFRWTLGWPRAEWKGGIVPVGRQSESA